MEQLFKKGELIQIGTIIQFAISSKYEGTLGVICRVSTDQGIVEYYVSCYDGTYKWFDEVEIEKRPA